MGAIPRMRYPPLGAHVSGHRKLESVPLSKHRSPNVSYSNGRYQVSSETSRGLFSRPLAGKTVVHLRAKICLVPTYTINKPWRLRCPLPDRAHGIAPRIEGHASVDRGTTLELRVD